MQIFCDSSCLVIRYIYTDMAAIWNFPEDIDIHIAGVCVCVYKWYLRSCSSASLFRFISLGEILTRARALCAFVLSSCLWFLIKVSPYFVCFAGVATLPTPPPYVCVCVCVNLHMFLLVWKSRYLFGAKFHLLGSRIYSPWTWPPPLKSIESFWGDSETSFRLKKNSRDEQIRNFWIKLLKSFPPKWKEAI